MSSGYSPNVISRLSNPLVIYFTSSSSWVSKEKSAVLCQVPTNSSLFPRVSGGFLSPAAHSLGPGLGIFLVLGLEFPGENAGKYTVLFGETFKIFFISFFQVEGFVMPWKGNFFLELAVLILPEITSLFS